MNVKFFHKLVLLSVVAATALASLPAYSQGRPGRGGVGDRGPRGGGPGGGDRGPRGGGPGMGDRGPRGGGPGMGDRGPRPERPQRPERPAPGPRHDDRRDDRRDPNPGPRRDDRHDDRRDPRPAPGPRDDRRDDRRDPRPAPGPRHDRFDRDRWEGRGPDMGRRQHIERRRQGVREDRMRRQVDIRRNMERTHDARRDWRMRSRMNVHRDISRIRSYDRWSSRYDRWFDYCPRPSVVIYRSPIRWYVSMPVPGNWSMAEVESVAINMEHLSRDVYDQMADAVMSNPNREYADRLLRVLAEMEDAAENFNDAVNQGYDYSDSLNDLFYLEESIQNAERTLDGYSKAYLVDEEMRSMRYYVDELLWQYRQTY
ncbi:MAG TPA: hypothetical protein VM432_05290 [Bdellovibrionales bacterium]|nr:hypothetical protein [Bdellovibrionales bacterium]